MKRSLMLFIILALGFESGMAQTIKHKFIALVENRDFLIYVDENNPSDNWSASLSSIGKNNDMQLVGNNRVMVTFERGFGGKYPGDKGGFLEFDLANKGAIVRDCFGITPSGHETSCHRMLNGNTRLFRNNWDSGQPITGYEFDTAAKNIVRQWQWKDGNTNCIGSRMVRRTSEGTYTFGTTNTNAAYVYEGDTTGKATRRVSVPGVGTGNSGSVYKAIKLQNGNFLVSCGFATKIVEINPSGNVIRTLDATAPNSGKYFYGCFQILENGNIALCNWRGHNATIEGGGRGCALLEYDTNGKVVWSWKDANDSYSCHKIYILDSVDTKYLYYDVYGKLTRISPETQTWSPAQKAPVPLPGFNTLLTKGWFSPLTVPYGSTKMFTYDLLGKKIGEPVFIGGRTAVPLPASGRQTAVLRFSK